jgi:3-hydroxybutyryl-CoA dehydrogenase
LVKEDLMDRIGVVGCGLMGSGIAEIAARAGADVVVIERDESAVAQGLARIERSLSRATSSGKITEDESNRIRANLTFGVDYAMPTRR